MPWEINVCAGETSPAPTLTTYRNRFLGFAASSATEVDEADRFSTRADLLSAGSGACVEAEPSLNRVASTASSARAWSAAGSSGATSSAVASAAQAASPSGRARSVSEAGPPLTTWACCRASCSEAISSATVSAIQADSSSGNRTSSASEATPVSQLLSMQLQLGVLRSELFGSDLVLSIKY